MKKLKRIGIISLILVNISLTKNTKTFPKSNSINNCSATLEVEKNRNTKSIFKESIRYKLVLTNTSNKKTTYKIETEKTKDELLSLKRQSYNSKKSTKTSNLNTTTLNEVNKSIDKIVLNPGEKYIFKVKLSKPDDKSVNSWNLTKVIVYSLECNTPVASTVLKTYIPNPTLR